MYFLSDILILAFLW